VREIVGEKYPGGEDGDARRSPKRETKRTDCTVIERKKKKTTSTVKL